MWGKREEYRPIPIGYTVTTRMILCIKLGSNESHFNVSLIVTDKVTRQCPQTTIFFKSKGEPRWNRAEALLLTSLTPYRWAKTGSHGCIPGRRL